MKKLFETQIKQNYIVTEEMLQKLNVKKYDNGEDVKVGDKILFALLQDDSVERNINTTFKLIILKEEHFDLYHYNEVIKVNLPTILLNK